jgi:CRISPR-associated protein Cas1
MNKKQGTKLIKTEKDRGQIELGLGENLDPAGNSRVPSPPLKKEPESMTDAERSEIRQQALEILRKEFPPATPVVPQIEGVTPDNPRSAGFQPAAATTISRPEEIIHGDGEQNIARGLILPGNEPSDSAATNFEIAPIPDNPSEASAPEPMRPASPEQKALTDQTIPARMMNEFVYCQRLFYYEFVEGVFVESVDTLRGDAIHKRVDAGNGAMPKSARKSNGASSKARVDQEAPGKGTQPAGSASDAHQEESTSPQRGEGEAVNDEIIHSRSVQMGSERLGVVAKMDLIEVRTKVRAGPAGHSNQNPTIAPTIDTVSGGCDGPDVADSANLSRELEDLFESMQVCPVDYKAGAPKEGAEANELWDTDKMQLGLQALILRDNGYDCHEGVIYYRATKQRVRLPITKELEAWILQNIAQARKVITSPIPAPLVQSPKCVRCSLAPVCLPDETRMLSQSVADEVTRLTSNSVTGEADNESRNLITSAATKKDGDAPRRLIAARDDSRPLYLNTPGYRVGCKDEVLQVKDKDKVIEEVRMRDVSHVALLGNIQISTQAIQSLCELEVPVTYFSMGGWFYGITRGHSLKNVFLRMEQFRLARDEMTCLSLARQFVHGKIRNQRTLLMRNHLEPPESIVLKLKRASEDALAAGSLAELLGIEGAAASQYFQQFNGMVKVEDDLPGLETERKSDKQLAFNFNFGHRNRRPPTDPVNAMLSLAYSMLAKDCTLAALAVGFDPYLGFYHQPRFGRPALGLDLMEEFRPLVAESTVLSCINNRVVTEKDFVRAGQAVNLTTAGRKRFFQTYEQRMSSLITHPLFDYKVSYRRALELQARLLAKTLTGEIPAYVPLLTR